MKTEMNSGALNPLSVFVLSSAWKNFTCNFYNYIDYFIYIYNRIPITCNRLCDTVGMIGVRKECGREAHSLTKWAS